MPAEFGQSGIRDDATPDVEMTMVRHNMNHETLLPHLDALCAQCRALATSQHEKMGSAIRKACDSCKSVRSSLPQLVELAQSMKRFNSALAAARAR